MISLWQPWATLMAIGAKRIETRSWSTAYSGWLAIHASKGGLSKRDLADCLAAPEFEAALAGETLEFGKIVAVVNLLACVPTEMLAGNGKLSEQERAFGDYAEGRFGWLTDSLFRLPEPIPFKAKQGLFDVPSEVVFECWRQLDKLARRAGHQRKANRI